MKGLKQCDKGHYFEENIDVCPYCPKQSVSLPKTEFTSDKKSPEESPKGTDVLSTALYAGTEKVGGSETPIATKIEKSPGNTFDPLKTSITPSEGAEGDKIGETTQRRKLRGWLVTFDLFDFYATPLINSRCNSIIGNGSHMPENNRLCVCAIY